MLTKTRILKKPFRNLREKGLEPQHRWLVTGRLYNVYAISPLTTEGLEFFHRIY